MLSDVRAWVFWLNHTVLLKYMQCIPAPHGISAWSMSILDDNDHSVCTAPISATNRVCVLTHDLYITMCGKNRKYNISMLYTHLTEQDVLTLWCLINIL